MMCLIDSIPRVLRAGRCNIGANFNREILAASSVGLSRSVTCRADTPQKRWRSTSAGNGSSYLFHQGSEPLLEMTIGQLLDQAANRYPDRIGLVSMNQNVRLTFSEILQRADKLAAGLKQLGLEKGDRIGIWGPNTVEWYLTFMAIARAGFKMVGMNPADQSNELEYGIQKVGIRAVVAPDIFKTQKFPEMLLSAKKNCPTLEHIVIAGDHHLTGTRRFVDVESLASRVQVEAIGAEQSEISPNDGACIQFTSGTTGRPKAPEVSHRSYVNNARQGMKRAQLDVGHHTVCLNVPFFHAFGILMGQLATLHAGATMVLAGPSFKPKESIDTVVKEKCSMMYGTPTMWVDLVNAQQEMKAPIEKLANGVTCGSLASPELFKRVRETFGFDSMKSLYGLSETVICFQTLPGTPVETAESTVGHISDHIEAQVVDENGVLVPFGTPGELWVRGYHTMIGYWGDEENTKKTISEDGWLKTGDQFILSPDGHGKILGRLKDMVIRGGENIYPKEVQDYLETHPAVMEANVFGVYDERMGEEVCACIRLRNGAELTAADIKSYGKGKISHYKIPRYVFFTQNFPRTTNGKIKTNVLRESLEARGVVPARPKPT
ncbi:medium-chain acyl-CoA ligase ACSF2, mitochondrial-like [Athalia rosae]|uniref:medium-chain acyl-CoA ligase ACSF2, mitochondrial-like n=1 Tax=Athalia rosae TaxID=37344 RepID=UPI002033BF1E|nr:medium-chain acyl-CoA ligase ACSF2, mitochondrial-like [Athalia rosae]